MTKRSEGVAPERLASALFKYSHGGNSDRFSINNMIRNAGAAAGTEHVAVRGPTRSTESALQHRTRNQTYRSMLRAGTRAVLCLVRWVVFEVLPLPRSTRSYHVVGTACRLIGCGVSLGILAVGLRARATSHGEGLALLWAVSVLTAVLIGNIARELMFAVCTSVATWMGRAFHREGVTLGGRTFLEMHYPTKTWARSECGADEFSHEWTEESGRCNRVEIQLRANSAQNREGQRPVIRVITAPRMLSNCGLGSADSHIDTRNVPGVAPERVEHAPGASLR